MASGQWSVLIVDRHCHVCQQQLDRVRAEQRSILASRSTASPRRIRIIDISSDRAGEDRSALSELSVVAMRADILYAVEVPLEVTLRDGRIEMVRKLQ